MLNIQKNLNSQNNNLNFKSNLSLKIIRNTFFNPYEKASIDILTKEMNQAERVAAVKSQAYLIGIKPLRMIANFFKNLYCKLN